MSRRVTYLVGAGGTQASISAVGSPRRILMDDLVIPLAEEARALVQKNHKYRPLQGVVNDIAQDADFEHVITFLDDSPSALHREFAGRLRRIFETVLIRQLRTIAQELGPDRLALYVALLDMHNVPGLQQLRSRAIVLSTIMLAYDEGIESEGQAHTLGQFMAELVECVTWQMQKGLEVDREYRYLVAFQRHLRQASVEKLAVSARAEALKTAYGFWQEHGAMPGDAEYKARTGRDAKAERRGAGKGG